MTRTAPNTGNPEAAALIREAQARCEGCRLNWRLDKRSGYKHRRVPGGLIECTAKEQRQALRDIALRKGAVRPAQNLPDGYPED